MMNANPNRAIPIKALTLDLFGTVVDWRTSLAVQAERRGLASTLEGCQEFARRWASKYVAYVRSGKPWRPLGDVLREAGAELFAELGITPNCPEMAVNGWEYLCPYEDSRAGLESLRQRFTVAALSNADTELVRLISLVGGLEWDRILGNELFGVYKPDLRIYWCAAWHLKRDPAEICMVAAHLFDLEAAKKVGFQTAFIWRDGEERGSVEMAPYVDFVADDLIALASVLPLPE